MQFVPLCPRFGRSIVRAELFGSWRRSNHLPASKKLYGIVGLGLLAAVIPCTFARAQNVVPVPADVAQAAPAPGFLRSSSYERTWLEAPGYSSSLESSGSGGDERSPNLPQAPAPQGQSQAQRNPTTKRILGIIPNFRTVSTDEQLPPQTAKQKFVTAAQDSFDYSSIFIPAALAGYSLGTNADPEFGSGGVGYGRYLWHSAVDQTSENFLVEAIFPSILHEDARYYTLGRGRPAKRVGYALSRVLYTRSDAGKRVFNISEIAGAGAAAGISNLYYPSRERSFGNTGKQWGLNIGVDAVSFIFKEYWPDVNQRLFGVPKAENTNSPAH